MVRDALVKTRSRYISVMRTLVRAEGLRVRSGASRFPERVAELALPAELAAQIAPLVEMLRVLNTKIADADHLVL